MRTRKGVAGRMAPVCRAGSSVGVSHLLVATDVLSAGYWGSSQVAVCGAEIHPGGGTVMAADEDPAYCPVCVRAAVRWSTRRTGR